MISAICDDTATAVDERAPCAEGTRALVDRPAGETMMFRFNRETETATLYFRDAELDFRCVDGVIEMSSTNGIRIRSNRMVEIAGETGTKLASSATALELRPLSLTVRADDLKATVSRTDFTGHSLNATADHVKVTWGTCQRVVGRAFEYARHAYSRVEILLHTRAGRIRTETIGSHVVQAGTARIKAKEDVRIQGASINLG